MVYLNEAGKTLYFLNQRELFSYHMAYNRPYLIQGVEHEITLLFFNHVKRHKVPGRGGFYPCIKPYTVSDQNRKLAYKSNSCQPLPSALFKLI